MLFSTKVSAISHNNQDYTNNLSNLCECLIKQDAKTEVSALNTKAIKRLLLEAISNTPDLIAALQTLDLKNDTNALTKLLCSPRKITRPALPFGETSSSRELQRMVRVVSELITSQFTLEYDDGGAISLQPSNLEKLHRGDAYLRRALAYFNERRFARAYFDFEVARQFKIHEVSVDMDEHVGACLVFMRQYKEAIPYLNAALKSNPNNERVGLYRRICEVMSPMPVVNYAENDNPIYDQMLKDDAHPLIYLKNHSDDLVNYSKVAKVLMDGLNDSDRLQAIANIYGLERLLDLLEALPLHVYEGDGGLKGHEFNFQKAVLQKFIAVVRADEKFNRKADLIQRLEGLLNKRVEDAVVESQAVDLTIPRSRSWRHSIFVSVLPDSAPEPREMRLLGQKK